MARILLWSSVVRVHDSQAFRKMDVTRERISCILELREILLSFQTGFKFSLSLQKFNLPNSAFGRVHIAQLSNRNSRQMPVPDSGLGQQKLSLEQSYALGGRQMATDRIPIYRIAIFLMLISNLSVCIELSFSL